MGVSHIHPNEILKLAEIDQKSSLPLLSTSLISKKLAREPRLTVLKIKKIYPDGLEISIEEKQGTFITHTGNTLTEIDTDFKIIGTNTAVFEWDMPYLRGKEGDTRMNQIVTFYKALPPTEKDLINIVSEITFDKDVILYTKGKRLEINLGMFPNFETFRKVKYAILYMENKKLSHKKIDISDGIVKFTM